MDADDAVDLWENIDESVKELRPMIDDETKSAILLINSYDDSEVGSLITTNYICIKQNLTIRQAMHELVKQAGENYIGTIYVVDDKNRFCGAIDLKDLSLPERMFRWIPSSATRIRICSTTRKSQRASRRSKIMPKTPCRC